MEEGRELASGFVLAGGRSSRMGRDKALAPVGGRLLVEIAVGILREAGLTVELAGARSELSAFAPVVPDSFVDAGPLGGVHAALASSRAEFCVFLPVDMPLMPADAVRTLMARALESSASATYFRMAGHAEPFPVVLRRTEMLPVLAERLGRGECGCLAAWMAAPSKPGDGGAKLGAFEEVPAAGGRGRRASFSPELWFQGANTPEELAHVDRVYRQEQVKTGGNRVS